MIEHEIGGERQLEDLRDRGVLIDAEFQRARERGDGACRTQQSRRSDIAPLEDLKDHAVLTDKESQRAKEKAAG